MRVPAARSAGFVATIALALSIAGPGFVPARANAELKCPENFLTSPCLDTFEPGGDKLVAYWDNKGFWTSFIFMWQRPGGELHWHELGGNVRKFTVSKAWRDTKYTFKIQGCGSFLMPGRCSELMVLDYTTLDFYPPVSLEGDVALRPVPPEG